ncbi:MAG: gamma-aminobutyrate dehydratase [Desulfobacteraceae bacterium]|nr:MAG: gamma-aminobutyrate dehydratase [Desulfobacteraceae bacterium]
MPLRTPVEYIESLRDDREVWFRGKRVPDVTEHPVIGKAVQHAAIDYRMAESDAHRDLAVVAEGGRQYSRYYKIPESAEDLLLRSRLIETATAEGDTLVVLIKEIGTDALFALLAVTAQMDNPVYHRRVRVFYEYCRDNDLALATAQTDVKGNRVQRPSEQADPDLYVRVVERRDDGLVVRGAKIHTSVTPNANEVIVLPTRAMGAQEADWSIAFALPVNTPGVKLLTSPFGDAEARPGERPISARHKMMETMTVFDDVFVPNDRIFLDGDTQRAGLLALTFVEYHRFTAVSYKLPLVDAIVGAAATIADFNGILGASHVREKLISLIAYAETLRALTQKAAERCVGKANGQVAPDPLMVNIAKSHFAHGYHTAVQHLQELAGGILVTGPGDEDWASQATRPYLEKYLVGRRGVDAAQRMRMMNFIRDLTASEYGAYQEVLAIHAEGSLEAEKLQIFRSYTDNGSAGRVMDLARKMAQF